MNRKGFFISGTDTGIGKTLVSALLLLACKGIYWKPLQSGVRDGTDLETVRNLTGLGDRHFIQESYRLREPLSPHLAAEIEGINVTRSQIIADFRAINVGRWTDNVSDFEMNEDDATEVNIYQIVGETSIIIEGAGGVLVPINDSYYMADLMSDLGYPVILVCRSTLGTINHTLMSLEILRSRSIPVAGVVMNGKPDRDNRIAIEKFGRVRVLAEIPDLHFSDKDELTRYGHLILESLRYQSQ